MSSPFRALRSRNYRLFFIGQGISLIGSWMTRLATSWLVYRLTESAFLLGLALWLGAKAVGVEAPFRIARQLVAFAALPIALSLVVVVPDERRLPPAVPKARKRRVVWCRCPS